MSSPAEPAALPRRPGASLRERLSAVADRVEAHSGRWAVGTLAAVMMFAAVVIYRKGYGTIFYQDDWAWFIQRRSWDIDTFLRSESGHLDALPLLVYKVLFSTIGLEHYGLFRLALIATHLGCVALLFVYVRRRLGDALALLACVPVALLGSGWQNLLLPIQLSFLFPVAAGLGAWLLLERRSTTADAAASALLVLGLASSAVGLSFAVGVLAELLLERPRLRAWVAVVPLALFGLWHFDRGGGPLSAAATTDPLGEFHLSVLPQVPAFAAEAAGAGLSGLLGLGLEWSRPLLAIAACAAIWRILRMPRVSARVLGLIVTTAVYVGELGAFRAGRYSPAESRYTYLLSILAILIAAELASGMRASRPWLAVLAVVALAAVAGNVQPLRDGSLQLQQWSSIVGGEFGAVEIAGASADPNWVPDPVRLPFVTAGAYLAAVRELGSPAFSPAGIAGINEFHRQVADQTLLQGLGVALQPAGRAVGPAPVQEEPPPRDPRAHPATVKVEGPCLVGGAGTIDAAVPPGGVILEARHGPLEVRLRSFGIYFVEQPYATVPAGGRALIAPPARPGIVWHVRATTAGDGAVCAAA
jgi:hypothetical protein